MKKLLILFGVLDFITVIKGYHNVQKLIFNSNFSSMHIPLILIFLSFIFSGYFLIRQKEIGLWISYLQFPLRLIFAFFSLGFLMLLNSYFNDLYYGGKILTAMLVILEVGRLILSIMIHRKYFR